MKIVEYQTNHEAVEQRAEEILQKMSLEEKVSLLSGKDNWHTFPIERLGIPSLTMTDGPHGVRAPEGENRLVSPATSFPTGVSMASSWNPGLIERVGAALAEETRALECEILLAPTVNIVRTPLAGRNFESYSEDPYLAARIGVAFVKGVQSYRVGASVKHFACNNQETERMRSSSEVDERTLREIYLPAFEAVVKEARPWTVMCSYNRLNSVYASENASLLTEILRKEWGFEGVVISDWGANHSTVESVNAGLDIEMPGPARYYGEFLVHAVQNWKVDEATIDQAARRILCMILKSGKLNPHMTLPLGAANTPEHQELARELAEESIVLLKNERKLLPFKPGAIRSIAVIGPNAAEARIGGGGSSFLAPPYSVSPLDGLRARLGDSVKIKYSQGCLKSADSQPNKSYADDLMAHAVELARKCDVAVLFMGMPVRFESEEYDRPDMDLPGRQAELIEAVAKANANTIVALNAGSPVSMPWIDRVPAVLEAFYPGQEGGNAVAKILCGDVNPSGKLSVTFPRRLEDNPSYINYPGGREVRYGEGIFVGYRYYDKKKVEPLFPFGFGLSYTTFEYSQLELPESAFIGEPVHARVKVANIGDREGKEVVQVYVSDLQSSLTRPPKELKVFKKIFLHPGESQEVEFILDHRSFAFYDPLQRQWIVEPGEFEILVGSSSRDIRARRFLTLS